MKRKLILISLVCFVIICGINVQVDAAEKDYTISVSFEQVPLGSVLRVLSGKTGRKFITDTSLANKRIVLHLKDVTPDEAVNALLDTYNLYYVRQADTNIYVIKSKEEGSITTVSKIFYCNYASAEDLVEVLEARLNPGGDLSPDSRTNSIIVTDMADNIDKIGLLIKELDSPTPQIVLEARIIDVKIDQNFQLGVGIENLYKTGNFWTDPLASERVKVIDSYSLEDTDLLPESLYTQNLNPNPGIAGRFNFNIIHKEYNINAIIEAIKENTNSKVISSPKLLCMNNQQAQIIIADEIPYQKLTQTAEGTMVSTEFKAVGVTLQVKPLVNNDGTIVLEVVPEQSFNTGFTNDNIPIVNASRVETTLLLKDGETAVIGGLIREDSTASEYKIPILGDIPIVGYLFKRVTDENTRKELTIFITANIVKDYIPIDE